MKLSDAATHAAEHKCAHTSSAQLCEGLEIRKKRGVGG